jgi:hypothetical protein
MARRAGDRSADGHLLLFELQGAANATSSALDHVLRPALGLAGRTRGPGSSCRRIGRWDPPGSSTATTWSVRGLGARRLARETAVVVARTGPTWSPRLVPTADLTLRPVHGMDPELGLVEVTGRCASRARHRAGRRFGDWPRRSPWPSWPSATSWSAPRGRCSSWPAGTPSSGSNSVGPSARSRPSATGWPRRWWPSRRPTPCWSGLARPVTADRGHGQGAGRAGARTAARHCQQVLAGIGFTTEHEFHLYVRRVLVLDELFGSSRSLTRSSGRSCSRPSSRRSRLCSPARTTAPVKSDGSAVVAADQKNDASEFEQFARALGRGDELVTTVPDRHHPQRDVSDAGIGEADCRRFTIVDSLPAGEDVADVPGVPVVEQLLVVRGDLGLGQDPVGAGHGGVDLLVAAEADRDAGHHAGSRPAGRLGRPRQVGTTWDPMARSSAIHRMVPRSARRTAPACGGPSAASRTGVGVISVMSSGLCTRKDSFSTSTGRGRPAPGRGRRGRRASWPRGARRAAQHLVDDPMVRDAETEGQTTLADGLDRQDLLGQGDRVAGLHRHDGGADLDAGRRGADHGGGGQRVELVGDLRDPDGGEAGLFRPRASAWSRSTLVR